MSAAETRAVSEFDRIDLRGVGTVIVRQGKEPSLSVEAPDKILDKVRTEVRDRELIISLRWWAMLFNWAGWDRIEIQVVLPHLRGLVVSGAGRISTPEPIQAEELALKLSGAGRLDVEVRARRIEARLSGAGSISAAGSAEFLDMGLTGAGRFRGRDLVVKEAQVRSAGAGETEVHVTDSLDVVLTGAGRIRYRGSPKVTSRISGVGSLESQG